MLAYLLISLMEKTEEDIKEELKKFPQVKESHIVFGEWDLVAKVEFPNPEALSTFIIDEIRTMPEIKMTSTLIVAK